MRSSTPRRSRGRGLLWTRAGLASLARPQFAWIAFVGMGASCSSSSESPRVVEQPTTDAGAEAGVIDSGAAVEAPIPCDQADFCQVDVELGSRLALTSVFGSGGDNVWAVGTRGTALHFDGTAWRAELLPSAKTLRSVWLDDGGAVWAAASATTLYRGTGPGSGPLAWEEVTALPLGDKEVVSISVWGVGGQAVAAYSNRTEAGLATATLPVVGSTASAMVWGEVSVYSCDCDANGTPSRTVWGSALSDVWQLAGGKAFRGAITPSAVDAGTSDGSAVDAGASWREVDMRSEYAPLYAVWGPSSAETWMVGYGGRIRHVSGDAAIADVIESPTSKSLHGLWGSGPRDVWAVGEGGVILHYDGSKWTSVKVSFSQGPADLYSVWGDSAGVVWVVGQGVVLRHPGGGS